MRTDWKVTNCVTFMYKYQADSFVCVLDLWETTEHPGLCNPEKNKQYLSWVYDDSLTANQATNLLFRQ